MFVFKCCFHGSNKHLIRLYNERKVRKYGVCNECNLCCTIGAAFGLHYVAFSRISSPPAWICSKIVLAKRANSLYDMSRAQDEMMTCVFKPPMARAFPSKLQRIVRANKKERCRVYGAGFVLPRGMRIVFLMENFGAIRQRAHRRRPRDVHTDMWSVVRMLSRKFCSRMFVAA